MGDVIQFPKAIDKALREWVRLTHYDRDASSAAQTRFYRQFFAAADRQGYWDRDKPSDSE